jgi:signal transduction histidine kinase
MGAQQEQKQPFAALVIDALIERSEHLAHQWMEHAQLAAAHSDNVAADSNAAPSTESTSGAGQLIRALLAATIHGASEPKSLTPLGMALGVEAHRRRMSLHLMLKEVDLLSKVLLRGAEEVTSEHAIQGTAREGVQVSHLITEAVSQLQLTAVIGYTEVISAELRERYRAIRHDLRNPLGTIKSAVALLTDETIPVETRESGRVRALVARNTSSLDELIDKALGDTAARLHAFETPREPSAEPSRQQPAPSTREKRDDVARSSERPDFEPGTF